MVVVETTISLTIRRCTGDPGCMDEDIQSTVSETFLIKIKV